MLRVAAILCAVIALAACAPRDGVARQNPASGPDETPLRTTPGVPGQDSARREHERAAADQPVPEAVAEPPDPIAEEAAQANEGQPRDPTPPVPAARPEVLHPFPHIEVRLAEHTVLIDGFVCFPERWLEQIVCTPGTREHESLVFTTAKPSHIHAALLMAGHQPGSPGAWHYDNDQVTVTPPTGAALEVLVRYKTAQGETVTEPIRNWIRDGRGDQAFPDDPWVFGGSIFRPMPKRLGEGEIYVADFSGSVVGLVTFGDEVVGFSDVLADDESIQAPEWVVAEDRIPEPGTPVTVIFRPAGGAAD